MTQSEAERLSTEYADILPQSSDGEAALDEDAHMSDTPIVSQALDNFTASPNPFDTSADVSDDDAFSSTSSKVPAVGPSLGQFLSEAASTEGATEAEPLSGTAVKMRLVPGPRGDQTTELHIPSPLVSSSARIVTHSKSNCS
jgi:hypothetical protein